MSFIAIELIPTKIIDDGFYPVKPHDKKSQVFLLLHYFPSNP